MLTDEVQIVQVAAHVVPQPIASAIEDDTVLLSVVVVRLVLAPGRLLHYFTCVTSCNIYVFMCKIYLFYFLAA